MRKRKELDHIQFCTLVALSRIPISILNKAQRAQIIDDLALSAKMRCLAINIHCPLGRQARTSEEKEYNFIRKYAGANETVK